MNAEREASGRGRAAAPARFVFVAPLALAAALAAPLALSALAACGGDDDDGAAGAAGQAAGPPAVSPADAIYGGGTTDEAYRAVVGVPPAVDARAATFASPAAGATMSAATPPTFSWSAAQVRAEPPAGRPLWARAWDALIERPAYAHGTPYTGVAYLLSITSAAGEPLYTALTPDTTFTPDPISWAAVGAAAAGELRVWLVTARVEQNAVVGGGPWVPSSGALSLRLGP